MFHDELRTGTRTELGCKWTPLGHRPLSPVHVGYENIYLYLTLCPFTGQGFAAFLPKLNSEWFGWFVGKVADCVDQLTLFVADGATAHKRGLFAESGLVLARLPAACPDRTAEAVKSGGAFFQRGPQGTKASGVYYVARGPRPSSGDSRAAF